MSLKLKASQTTGFIVTPKPPLFAVVIVPRGFCPKMRPC
ncbi:rfbP protein [Vibrio cholerae]|nr:rfbP protein [Vibrio cholerae]EGR0030576.1 rfbP protein [Vibrio cholerae]EGR5565824.1 rfbP protein [Vibrio cholerae]EGR5573226.1 rfbP protein [Vibrio cholerae]TQQ30553.1 rfbP protein [Vibrio cholerae]